MKCVMNNIMKKKKDFLIIFLHSLTLLIIGIVIAIIAIFLTITVKSSIIDILADFLFLISFIFAFFGIASFINDIITYNREKYQ